MKFNINEKDLILSDSFKKKESEFNKTLDGLITVEKDKISQTIEAKLFFSQFKSTYLYKTKKYKDHKRFKFIIKDLIKSFPEANVKEVKKHLYLNGIFAYNPYIFILIVTLVLFNTITIYCNSLDWFLLITSNISLITIWKCFIHD